MISDLYRKGSGERNPLKDIRHIIQILINADIKSKKESQIFGLYHKKNILC